MKKYKIQNRSTKIAHTCVPISYLYMDFSTTFFLYLALTLAVKKKA